MKLIGTCKTNDVSVMVFETRPDERKPMLCGDCPNWKPSDDCWWMGACAKDNARSGHKAKCRHGLTTSANHWSERYWDMWNTRRVQVRPGKQGVSMAIMNKENAPMVELDALFKVFE